MASTQVVETSVANNGPSQDSSHPDDYIQSGYVAPGFKPFSWRISFLFSEDEGILKFDLLVWTEVHEMTPTGE